MREMTAVSARHGYRQFYYGGDVGVGEKLKEALVKSAPGLQVAGTFCPPFREMTPKRAALLSIRSTPLGRTSSGSG